MTSAKTRNVPRFELQKILGVSRSRINHWVTAGLPHDSRPWKNGNLTEFNVAEVFAWVVAFESSQAAPVDGGNVVTFKDQRERLAAAQADKVEIQAAMLRNDLVRLSAVEMAWSSGITAARDLFRMIPMSAVDRVMAAAEEGRAAVKACLEDEIDDALRRVAAMEIVIEADEDDGETAAA